MKTIRRQNILTAWLAFAARDALDSSAPVAAFGTAFYIYSITGVSLEPHERETPPWVPDGGTIAIDRSQARLVREVFGNPFRAVSVPPVCRAWNSGTMVKLAQAIYDDRAFDRLPVLADALEESGCTDPVILDHCRSGGEHVRGCWVVDLLLGKG